MNLPFQIPYVRKSVPALGNPVFVDDVVAANQLTLNMLGILIGSTGFAIIYGLIYSGVSPSGTYSPGLVYFNSNLYFVPAISNEGLYLTPANVDINPQPFSDTNNRPTYTLLQAATTAIPGGPASLIKLSGNMKQYRMDLTTINNIVQASAVTIAGLGNSATLNVGQIIGTVAAGNDPRLVYTADQLDARYAQIPSVIIKGAGTAYTPIAATDPVNVGYLTENFPQLLASGQTAVGDIPTGGVTVPLAFGSVLNSTNYYVGVMILSNGTPAQDATLHTPAIFNLTTAGCSVRLQEGVGGVQNVSLTWIILPLLNY